MVRRSFLTHYSLRALFETTTSPPCALTVFWLSVTAEQWHRRPPTRKSPYWFHDPLTMGGSPMVIDGQRQRNGR